MRSPGMLLTSIALLLALFLPTRNLPSYVCGQNRGTEEWTEVSAPRAGIGIPPLDPSPDLEFDVSNRTNDDVDVCYDWTPIEYEFHSGFGWEFVNFDGTDGATFAHLIAAYVKVSEDSIRPVESTWGADTLSYTLSSDSLLNGSLCAFETYTEVGIYNRLILVSSFLIDDVDTLAEATDWIGKVIYIYEDSSHEKGSYFNRGDASAMFPRGSRRHPL